MGADIYLQSVHNSCMKEWRPKFYEYVQNRDATSNQETKAKWHEKVEHAYTKMYEFGYFRDNYNSYGLFAQTSLSWWRDVLPMLDENGYLPISQAKKLKEMLLQESINLSAAQQTANEQNDKEPKIEHYEERRQRLIAILDQSIELNEPLLCSL